jgi:3,4-dihydroxy 2-butanone 4-phosphate synthase/GTP cyclohydrolase II
MSGRALRALKAASLDSLIHYRLKADQVICRSAEALFESRWGGTWQAITFVNKASGAEDMALVKGRLDGRAPLLVAIHQLDVIGDAFGRTGQGRCRLEGLMELIAKHGSGLVIVLHSAVPNPFVAHAGDNDADRRPGPPGHHLTCAQILYALGVGHLRLAEPDWILARWLESVGLKVDPEPSPAEWRTTNR